MSYDIYFRKPKCPTCGHAASVDNLPDPTGNLTPIFHLALTGKLPEHDCYAGLFVLDGRTGADTLAQLDAAVNALCDSPEKEGVFRALEPSNKWGDLEGARNVMKALRRVAFEHPDYVWTIR